MEAVLRPLPARLSELVMESVDIVEPEEDGSRYRLVNIFGEQKVIRGRITLMNLVDHKILFEKSE